MLSEEFVELKLECIEKRHEEIEKEQKNLSMKRNLSQYIPARLKNIISENNGMCYFSKYGECKLFMVIPWNPKLCDEIALLLKLFGWEYDSKKDSKLDDAGIKPQVFLKFYKLPLDLYSHISVQLPAHFQVLAPCLDKNTLSTW